MAFYKLCACGNKVVSESRIGFYDQCPMCGRSLIHIQASPEGDPVSETPVLEPIDNDIKENINDAYEVKEENCYSEGCEYALRFSNGAEIDIPLEGGIIGRTEIGGEELADYGSVSRKHIKVIIKRNIVVIEDLSKYGTLINGTRIERNMPTRVEVGAKIVLCNLELELVRKGD